MSRTCDTQHGQLIRLASSSPAWPGLPCSVRSPAGSCSPVTLIRSYTLPLQPLQGRNSTTLRSRATQHGQQWYLCIFESKTQCVHGFKV